MDALLNSKISYPTWKEISKKLAVQYVDPYKEFGDKSLFVAISFEFKMFDVHNKDTFALHIFFVIIFQ